MIYENQVIYIKELAIRTLVLKQALREGVQSMKSIPDERLGSS